MTNLNASQAADLRRISQIDAGALASLVETLLLTEPSIKLSDLREVFGRYIEDIEQAGALFRWAYFAKTISTAATPTSSPKEVFTAIAREALGEEEKIELSEQHIECVSQIASSAQLYAVWQSQNLSRDAEHVLQNINIMLDCRPVYDEAREKITGEILMPFLKINYSDGQSLKSISLAADSTDIEKLKVEIEKIERKIKVARDARNDKCYLVGEEVENSYV